MTSSGTVVLRPALTGATRFVLAAAVFAAAEVFATGVLGTTRMPLGLVLLAGAIVATLFWLTRTGLQAMVDRLLFGERAGAFEAGRALLQRMSTTLPVDDILPALAETAGRTTHSARAEVRVLLSDGRPWSQVWPAQAAADGSAPLTIGVRHAGSDVGEIEVDPTDTQEKDRDLMVLDDLARPAGLALDTVRLTVELRRRAADLQVLGDELELSNARILRARRDEIARLRGEVHQRVTPHIERAEALVRDEIPTATSGRQPAPHRAGTPEQQRDRLDLALTEVAAALESLRTLARGIYPPRLADAGLAVSLEGWQQRSGIALDFRLTGDEAALRRHADIESCLYFSLVTVLAALSRPGRTAAAAVSVSPGHVDAVISGPAGGGAETTGAAALQAVRDRIEAFDGQMTVEGPPLVSPPDSAPGSAPDATIRLRVPLPAAADAVAARPGTAESGPGSGRVAP